MIDVDHQLEIDRRRRKVRIVHRALHDRDVGDLFARDPALQQLEHLRLQVVGVDAAAGADAAGESHGDVARTGADVGDRSAFRDLQQIQRAIGFFFGLKSGLSNGGPPLIAGLVAVLVGTVEVTLREHLSGYRSHAILLAALPVIVLDTALVLVIAPIGAVVKVALLLPTSGAVPLRTDSRTRSILICDFGLSM